MKFSGIIIHGKWLGRELGYRTANMRIESSDTAVESGTYAIRWIVRWVTLEGVGVYLPHISTFESHFLDFDDDIYDENIEIEILYKIRENKKYDSLVELAEQIGKDIQYMKSMKNHTSLIAIAAMTKNRVIWDHGKIPWHIPEDFKHFKETTLGYPIIMGKNTYFSIGRPLPGRENIVLTQGDIDAQWITQIKSIQDLQKYLQQNKSEKAFICWWGQVYRSFLESNLVDEVILSVVDGEPEWDVFFPEFESDFILTKEIKKEWFSIQYWKKI